MRRDNQRFAYDAYRRLINMYGDVVCGVEHEHFEQAFDKIKTKYKAKNDTDVPVEGMIAAVQRLQEGLPEAFRQAVPARADQAARARDRGGVQELDAPRGGHVSPG